MKKCIVCILITALALGAMFAYHRLDTLSSQYLVETVSPEITSLRDFVTVRGKVVEKERRGVFLGFPAVVVDAFVSEGDSVFEGDLLMTVRATDESITVSAIYEGFQRAMRSVLTEQNEALEIMAQNRESNGVYYIYSPCKGTVMNVIDGKDTFISQSTACAVISDMDKLEVYATVDESLISEIRAGNDCTVTVPALGSESFEGTLTKVQPYAYTSFSLSGSNRVETEIRVSLPKKSDILKPGYSAVVNIITDVRENSIIIPFEAIGQDENDREYVLCLSDGAANKVYIETGKELTDRCEILSGISGDEKLILYPEKVPKGSVRLYEDS